MYIWIITIGPIIGVLLALWMYVINKYNEIIWNKRPIFAPVNPGLTNSIMLFIIAVCITIAHTILQSQIVTIIVCIYVIILIPLIIIYKGRLPMIVNIDTFSIIAIITSCIALPYLRPYLIALVIQLGGGPRLDEMVGVLDRDNLTILDVVNNLPR